MPTARGVGFAPTSVEREIPMRVKVIVKATQES
jgi:hypothetical protein